MKTLLISLCALASIAASAQSIDPFSWDGRISYDLNKIESTKNSSRFVSNAAMPAYVAIPSAMYVYGVAASLIDAPSPDRRYMAETGLQQFVTLGITYGAVLGLKMAIDRERPYQKYAGMIENGEEGNDKYFSSMPSGHSAGAAAFATTMSLRYPHWYVIVPTVGWALWTGYARMNLGVHFLTDVLAGYALGAGIAYGVHLLSSQIFNLADPILPASGSNTALGLSGTPYTPIFSFTTTF
jgi:membrane-associated phospholipid phosphatase